MFLVGYKIRHWCFSIASITQDEVRHLPSHNYRCNINFAREKALLLVDSMKKPFTSSWSKLAEFGARRRAGTWAVKIDATWVPGCAEARVLTPYAE